MNKTKRMKQILANEEVLRQVLDTLIDAWGGQADEDQIYKSMTALRKLIINAQKQPDAVTAHTSAKPIAWAIMVDGIVYETITPDEHATYEGEYTTPLFTIPPTAC